jgi:protein-S-isoprenylcysteine O-methyltransferase Ste14
LIKTLIRTSCALLVLACAGCALTIDSTHLGVPATLAEAAQTPPQGTAFRVTKHPIYLFLGLLPVSQPGIEDVLAGQMGAGSAVANLRVKVTSRWTDLLVAGLTLGIVVPRSVTYEGVVTAK